MSRITVDRATLFSGCVQPDENVAAMTDGAWCSVPNGLSMYGAHLSGEPDSRRERHSILTRHRKSRTTRRTALVFAATIDAGSTAARHGGSGDTCSIRLDRFIAHPLFVLLLPPKQSRQHFAKGVSEEVGEIAVRTPAIKIGVELSGALIDHHM